MPSDLLKSVFGHDAFRDGQEEIVRAVASNKPVLAIMPTGGGKSLCFQLPALMRDGVTIVVSPLIALMRDQVKALRAQGVGAVALTSGNTDDEHNAVFEELAEGRVKLLYLAPERLANPSTEILLRKIGASLIAVDEAHCVSQWGHDFRPDYLRIGSLRKKLGVPLAAFTATADEETRVEIAQKLFEGGEVVEFIQGFDRPNIHISFAAKNGPRKQVLDFVAGRKGQSGILYCGTRAKTETLAQALNAEGFKALHYHAGMQAELRREAEARFQTEDGLIVVATIAFGMGIDKPDIRWVVHADLPKSIESYYQEIGRAGRDGAPAEALTLFGADDIRLRRAQIDEGLADHARKEADHGRLNALLGLAEARGCRRQILLRYFGEESEPCGKCDLCDKPPKLFDGTEAVRKALSAILRTGEWFGAGHVIDVLRGSETEKIRAKGHNTLPTFGVGKDLSKGEWQGVLRQMMGYDLVRPDPARYGALRMTQSARGLLKGQEAIMLRKDSVVAVNSAPKRVKELVSEDDEPMFAALKSKRRALAEDLKAPAYIVFPDSTLIAMAEMRPKNLDEFAKLPGVGAKKLERYGDEFLSVINGFTEEVKPLRRKMSGKAAGELFDRLQERNAELLRGDDGTGKPLTCTNSTLAKIAEKRPHSLDSLGRIQGMNEQKLDRFGLAFLDEILND